MEAKKLRTYRRRPDAPASLPASSTPNLHTTMSDEHEKESPVEPPLSHSILLDEKGQLAADLDFEHEVGIDLYVEAKGIHWTEKEEKSLCVLPLLHSSVKRKTCLRSCILQAEED